MPASTPCPERPEQGNILYSLLIYCNRKISATSFTEQEPLTSLLLAQNRQGMVDDIYLFSSSISSSLRATFILSLSEASTTNMIPSTRFEDYFALSCQNPRYFDCPDMSNTSKSIPSRVKVSFLNPMVGVISVLILSGSSIRDRIVVLPLLSSPTNMSFPSEFPIITLFKLQYATIQIISPQSINQTHRYFCHLKQYEDIIIIFLFIRYP